MRPWFLLLLLPLIACPPATTDDDDSAGDDDDATEAFTCDGITPEVIEISVDELVTMLQDKDFELINVHVPREGQIPGTDAHVRFDDTDALEEYLGNDVTAKAVLYCKTGPMSAIAATALVERGYCRIYDLPQAMVGWEAEGHELED
jgi:rhodanese-related sulfurtransferase